ncbi:putative quinol monooxygenase [Methyloversatilis sp. XJ19-49]|uniref:putative quinol monooxygenase n=1 Tax=Methyloversatilis sp. XJ19-49 TaxID=2963429 RepID=UPI00211BEB54|nr:antibiotic biosynthesis monooxygenase [Methyloversatilis sp. XJ19-49]MCQ9377668.1 antibiotic biosynthesis monooxygenase [Methyloversatilis sp. XJ19-49]
MFAPDTCCTLVPYFEVQDGQLDAFKTLALKLVAKTRAEPGCMHYAFSFSGNVAHCREGYVDAAAVLAHRENVAELLGQALKIAKIVSFEVHAPEAEIDKLRGPMASRSPQFFALEEGIRRSREA